MNKSSEDYLSEIYRGAKMGTQAIETLIDKVDDCEMRQELLREQKEYRKFEDKAINELNRRNITPKPVGAVQEMMTKIGVRMNTAVDATSSHIADILIQGNNMGIVGITKSKNRHECDTPDGEVDDLADELVKMQQKNIEKLKAFL